jgi:hypothetical protein
MTTKEILKSFLVWKCVSGNWCRKCSSCNSIIEHKGKYSKYNAIRSNKNLKLCFNCSNSDITNRVILNNEIWIKNGVWNRKCPKCKTVIKHTGRNSKTFCSFAHRNNRTCNSCANSKIYSDESKQKMREAVVRRIQKYGIRTRNYNPKACQFIESFGNQNGYKFQHAMNGGEYSCAGYLVDGYDKDKNVIFEYDEPFHNTPSYKLKDVKRQQKIIDTIHPHTFIRYDEKNNRVYDSITNASIL